MDSGSALRFAQNDGFGQSPNQSRQPTNPSAPGIAKRHRPDGPRPGPCCSKHPLLPVYTANAPHPKGNGIVARQALVPPSMIGLLASPNDPSARWQSIPPAIPAPRPADPVPTQSGRNSGPLILGIVALHRPD